MSLLVRIIETLTGRPHEKRNAEMVSQATRNLIAATDVFSERIEPYSYSEFPLEALFEDIKNQRLRNGVGDVGPKLHS